MHCGEIDINLIVLLICNSDYDIIWRWQGCVRNLNMLKMTKLQYSVVFSLFFFFFKVLLVTWLSGNILHICLTGCMTVASMKRCLEEIDEINNAITGKCFHDSFLLAPWHKIGSSTLRLPPSNSVTDMGRLPRGPQPIEDTNSARSLQQPIVNLCVPGVIPPRNRFQWTHNVHKGKDKPKVETQMKFAHRPTCASLH